MNTGSCAWPSVRATTPCAPTSAIGKRLFSQLTESEGDWLDRFVSEPETAHADAEAARQLVERVLEQLSPPARLVITLREIEGRSLKEIAALTGWSVPLVKVRGFRARAEMRRVLSRIAKEKYL